jgi:hypothetical protein
MARREDIAAGSGTRALCSITLAASEQTTECPAEPAGPLRLGDQVRREQVAAKADQPSVISAALEG